MNGSASVLAAVVIALILLLGAISIEAAGLVEARTRAQLAADAAALAAAPATFPRLDLGSPRGRARAVAAANGADLVECRCSSDLSWRSRVVVVRVRVRAFSRMLGVVDVAADAAAEFDPIDAVVGSVGSAAGP